MFRNNSKTAPRPRRRSLRIERLETRSLFSALPPGIPADTPLAVPLIEQNDAALIGMPLDTSPSAPAGYAPAEIRSAYGFSPSKLLTGAGQTIAIVVADNVFQRFAVGKNGAYDYSQPLPSLQDDLNTFDQKYKISGVTINVQTEDNVGIPIQPVPDPKRTSWEIEAALDVEWAHAIAPAPTSFSSRPLRTASTIWRSPLSRRQVSLACRWSR